MASLFIGRDASIGPFTGAFYGAFDRAFDGAFYRVFEKKARGLRGEGQGSSPNSIESDDNARKQSGGYVIRDIG
ncbi:hypothetical protein Tco_1446207 [Tanacetum coccineum]